MKFEIKLNYYDDGGTVSLWGEDEIQIRYIIGELISGSTMFGSASIYSSNGEPIAFIDASIDYEWMSGIRK